MRIGVRLVVAILALACVLGITGLVIQRGFERGARGIPPPGELIAIDGDRRLHIRCEGQGSPTVILEAGGTHFSIQYNQVLHALAATTRVCAYDRAGMGWSDPSPQPPTARALVSDLERLMTAAKLAEPYVLVAGSAGGMTAELFAREHPDRVAAVVFLDALTGRMIDDMPSIGDRMASRACLARTLNRFGILRLLDPLDRRALATDREISLALTYRAATWDTVCSLLRSRHASADDLRAAPAFPRDLPLVVVTHDSAGREALNADPDEAIPELRWQQAQASNAALSNRGELVVARGSGHHIVEDRPELVIEIASRLVATIRDRR